MSTDAEPQVSVIIPVFNVAPFLCQCLDSVARQTLQAIEIICIDDGSTDGSAAILSDYAARDSRFVIITQPNAGAGAARNNGLKAARGKYLSFLDADDFFEPGLLATAFGCCEKWQADFTIFRSDVYNNDTRKFESSLWTVKDELLPRQDVFSYHDVPRDLFKVIVGWAWDKLYRRDFVLANQLHFQEHRTTNDMFFVFSALVKAKRIHVCQSVLAHHRRSVAETLSVTREKSWDCFYHALEALKNELLAMGIYEEVQASFINYALHFSLWNLNTITGPAFAKLYNALRDDYFTKLEIPAHPAEYFYNSGEYSQYLQIRDKTLVIYLMDKVNSLQQELNHLKSKKNRSALSPLSNLVSRCIRACRTYGLCGALRIGWQKASNRIRR